jgi:hypothetical protein
VQFVGGEQVGNGQFVVEPSHVTEVAVTLQLTWPVHEMIQPLEHPCCALQWFLKSGSEAIRSPADRFAAASMASSRGVDGRAEGFPASTHVGKRSRAKSIRKRW